MIVMKLADTKLENSEAYLLNFGRNMSSGFKVIDNFYKN